MKRTLPYVLLGLALFFISCSNDSKEIEQEELGTLEVITIFEGGTTISEVTVSTIPETEIKITDNLGKAVFNNIPVGSYQIVITPSFSNVSLTITAEVKMNQVETVEVIVGPDPISETPIEFDFLLANIYNELKKEFLFDANGYSHYWGDIGMGIARINPDSMGRFGNLDNYIFSPGDFVIEQVWSEHYKVIRLTNIGLDELKNLDAAPEDIDPLHFESEFRFLRALLYFNLIKLYGNPILVTTAKIDFDNPPATVQGRIPIYELIIDDLKFAQQNLPSGLTDKSKASVEAVTALLGKVYLTMAGFPLEQSDKYAFALQEFDKIMGSFTLEEEYANVFAVGNEDSNTEIIFNIDFDNSGNYSVPWGPKGISFNDRLLLMPDFVNSFFGDGSEPSEPVTFPLNTDDSRFYQNIATFSYQNEEIMDETSIEDWRPYKFVKEVIEPSMANQESFDYPYLRMADVYLMIAEAENEANGGPTEKAYNALNQVRRRAFGDLDHDIQLGLSQEEFSNAIIGERRLEFCFEGQLKDDLIRMQALETEILNFNQQYPELARDFQNHEYIWPIPYAEINFNPGAVQNEGY
ncbi:MAG: RagB/SusD family nutrient uptake outer membrane protein [Allomuricauda sp.]